MESKVITDFKLNTKRDPWQKELLQKLVQKDKELECFKQGNQKMVDQKNALEAKLRSKSQEANALNDRISLLTKELAEVNDDYQHALVEIKSLNSKLQQSRHQNEILQQNKEIHSKIKKDFLKSEQLLLEEKLKRQKLETFNLQPHKWHIMKHVDPGKFHVLQTNNFLQKELQKKLDLLVSKDEQLKQKDDKLKKLSGMLKHRSSSCVKEPTDGSIGCRRTIQNLRERLKVMSAEVNMYESLLSYQLSLGQTSKAVRMHPSDRLIKNCR